MKMKQSGSLLVGLLTLLLAGAAWAQQTPSLYGKSWALVIGVNAYQHVTPRLTYAVADAKAVADALAAFGFAKQNIRVLLDGDATKAGIENVFYGDFANIGPEDRVFVYFAGHGETLAVRDGEEGYLLPVDADPRRLPPTAILMEDMKRIAKRLRAKHVFFAIDACFSGFAVTRDIVPTVTTDAYLLTALREPVVQVLTAGRKGQRAIEEGGHGLFTRRLLDGLRLADTEGRGFVTAGQLAAWIEPRVMRDSNGKMTPQYGKLDGEGQFVFLKAGQQIVIREAPGQRASRPTDVAVARPDDRPPQAPDPRTLLQQAIHIAAGLPDADKWRVLESAGTAFLKAGDRASAIPVLSRAVSSLMALDRDKGKHYLVVLAGRQAEAGDLAAARQTANAIADPTVRAGAMGWISAGAVKMGHPSAESLFQEALQAASALPRAFDTDMALQTTVSAHSLARDFERARRALAARKIKSDTPGWGIVIAQTQAGDISGAIQTALEIQDSFWRASAFTHVAEAQVKAGRKADAEATLKQVTGDLPTVELFRSSILSHVARVQAGLGDLVGAGQTIDRISTDDSKARALAALARAQALTTGQSTARATFQQALQHARQVKDPGKGGVLFSIASEQARAGRFSDALQTALGIDDEGWKYQAMVNVAATEGRIGDVTKAVDWATGQPSPYLHAAVLVGVASGVLHRLDPEPEYR